jgi:hypothetical protein
MKYLCTLSDKNYLGRGLALYKSLKRHASDSFILYYLALDDVCFEKLKGLKLPGLIPIPLSDLESKKKDLFEARNNRPYNEYCWTLASYFCHYTMSEFWIPDITYIDSDIFFYQDIEMFFKEVGTKPVGIIAHRHNTVGDRDGAYNVGIIHFKWNKGLDVLSWWKDAVLNKLYPHLQTCGDQKYLEEFIPKFGEENICIVDKTFGHGAPWNFRLYQYDKCPPEIIWNGTKQLLLFNHFSRMSYDIKTDRVEYTSGQYSGHTLNFGIFTVPAVHNFYVEYFKELKIIHSEWIKGDV